MPKISTYSNDATITTTDKFLGTDAADTTTKNFTVGVLDTFYSQTTKTLTNKTMDFSSAGTNTITLDAADVDYDNAGSGIASETVQAAIDEIVDDYVSLVGIQIITNKTMNFSSGGTNTLIADASDVIYNNAGSGLIATNVNAAIDEVDSDVSQVISDVSNLDSRILSYSTATEANTADVVDNTFQFKINACGAGASMTRTVSSAELSAISSNAIWALQNTDSGGNSVEIIFSSVTLVGQPSGTLTIDSHGNTLWFIKVSDTQVAIWGDYTITP